ncbi:hypothetical protein IFM89_031442 [Coptis chinensis]|uniref:Uncharacterized protein n=1 Tax=Coptis chinensis TaxID=261450 RepID=A0A835HI58_9MAGN|nr:hypothetical protein IFM89_031442 [Coptis chinensis]
MRDKRKSSQLRLPKPRGRVEELQNWKTASEAKLEFLMAHIGARFSVRSGANFSYLLSVVCPPFVECPARFLRVVGLPSTCPICSCGTLAGRARYPYRSLSEPPPIALAISYSSSGRTHGDACESRVGSVGQPLFNFVTGLSLLPDLERYYESSVPDSIAAGHLVFGTTKSLMLTFISIQREYAAPKIIPMAANVATKLFLWEAPTKMRNSPIKLLVPGELILASGKEGYVPSLGGQDLGPLGEVWWPYDAAEEGTKAMGIEANIKHGIDDEARKA